MEEVVSVVGLNVGVEPFGAPDTAGVTVLVKPLKGLNVTVYVGLAVALTSWADGESESV